MQLYVDANDQANLPPYFCFNDDDLRLIYALQMAIFCGVWCGHLQAIKMVGSFSGYHICFLWYLPCNNAFCSNVVSYNTTAFVTVHFIGSSSSSMLVAIVRDSEVQKLSWKF